MTDFPPVSLPVKNFLLIEECPVEWRRLNLYMVQDETDVFYVGQSRNAFQRVWRHFYDGFKGRSLLGRFILCNWPASMNFRVVLLSSKFSQFDGVGHDLNAAEQLLIEKYTPCLNSALNPNPAPIPERYCSPYTSLKFTRHPLRLLREVEKVVKAEQKKAWLDGDPWGNLT